MGILKWYKRDPDAALSGMMGLTLEERGAYNTVLDLLYTRDGNLPDDERFIAGWLSVDVRVWRRIRSRLLDLGKLDVVEGMISNLRATSEIHAALCRVEHARNAGLSKGPKSGAKSNKTNGKGPTPVGDEIELSTTTTTTTEESDADASVPVGTPAQPDLLGDEVPPPKVTAAHFVEIWNELAPKIGRKPIRFLTEPRRKTVNARIRNHSIADLQDLFDKIERSPFLRGDTPRFNGVTFDWITKQANFIKVLEGNYDD